jgi:hypothetical protein
MQHSGGSYGEEFKKYKNMNTYNLTTVEETTIIPLPEGGSGVSTTSYILPVDGSNNPVEYLTKFRILQNNQMLVFDNEQEYRDYLNGNNYLRP